LKTADPDVIDSWEWRWLWRQTNQSLSIQKTDSAVIDICIEGRHGIVALSNGQVKRFAIDDRGKISRMNSVILDDPFNSLPSAGLTNREPTALAAGVERITVGTARPEASAYGSDAKTDSSGHPNPGPSKMWCCGPFEASLTEIGFNIGGILIAIIFSALPANTLGL